MTSSPEPDTHARAFDTERARLLSLAYRMLGSAADAEDMVQEAWIRWEATDLATVHSPRAFLTTTVTRLCLDHLKSARARRETYPGPWLPEPVRTEEPVDLESISLAFLVLLERLSPVERAVYLLREVFDYRHAEIARVLGRSETACRQLHHRARERVHAARPRFAPTRADHERLLGAFASAVTHGDVDAIERVLSRDATLWGDGGGKALAASRPIRGGRSIARFFARLAERFARTEWSLEMLDVNGWPALVGRRDGSVELVVTIETDGARIVAMRNVLNPDKLALPVID